jgi:hypothetical protein
MGNHAHNLGAQMSHFSEILSVIHPQTSVDRLELCINSLPDVIGNSIVNTDEELLLDIGKLLAVADQALKAANSAKPARRQKLIQLAHLAVNRALWVSPFDPTNPEHLS